MDSVATNTGKEESTHVSPQYDSSEEWEIGLGNLIIDLDADLEKDRQDGSGAGGSNGDGTLVDSSPLRIGKMKIKRKVSTNTAVATPGTKGSTEGTSPRKQDNLLSGGTKEEGCLSTSGRSSPAAAMVKEEKSSKGGGRSVNSSVNASPHKQQDSNASEKHTERNMTNKGSIPLTSGDTIHQGKYSSSSSAPDKDSPSVDNNICRIKTVDLKNLTNTCKKEKETGGGRKKEEKEGKETAGKKGDGSTKKHGGKKRGDKASSNSIAVGTSDAETLTEPECLGPCEPGTSVNLEGIVWHETDQGVLVVNVTWRNKTYVGTLMDCTRHDWAPPRFCDSPTSDVENRFTKSCGRPKRGRVSNNSNNSNNSDMANFTETRSSVHSKLRNSSTVKGRKGASANGNRTSPVDKPQGKRKHRPSEVSASSGEDSKSAKRLKSSNNAKQKKAEEPPEPVPDANGLIECPEPNCSKKYKHINGLRYHRQHAHQEDKPDDDNEDDDQDSKSSSDESSGVSTPMDSVKSKEWNDSSRTSDTSNNDTKASSATSALSIEQSVAEKQRQQYSTAAAHAAATAAAKAAAAVANSSLELLLKEDTSSSKKGNKLSSDKTSPKILHGKNSTPVKSKGDASEKTGGKPKKSSSEKDLSVFDFNSTPESDSVPEPLGSDKHVSIIRPIVADMSTSSPLKETIAAPAKLQDVIHTTALPGSEHLEELQKHSKKSEKDKSKSGDRKKSKHEKVPSSKVKPTRPVSTTPTPPQLGAVPVNMAAKGTVPMATTQPMKIPQANGKPPVNPALKPMQQKPVVQSEGITKEKKKSKKKSKDKDKEREKTSSSAKDKESKDSVVVNNKQNVTPQQQSSAVKQQLVAPAIALPVVVPPKQPTPQQPPGSVLPETNILHQALTQSGITPEDAERNSPSVTGAGDIPKTDPSSQAPKDQSKDVRSLFPNRPPMHGNIPEIPKLIPTSSVVNSAGRGVGPMQPHMPASHPAKPLQPVQDNSKMDTNSAVPMPQMKPSLLPETDADSQPPAGAQTDERARSPAAYSDISDANEDNEVSPSKALNDRDPYSFQDASRNQAKVAPPSDEPHMHSKSLYTPLSEVGRDRVPDGIQKTQQEPHRNAAPPLIHPPFKGDGGKSTGKEGSHAEGPDAKKPRKDTSSPRLPPSSEAGYNRSPMQSYPGQYPPYMSPGFVMDPQQHMHLMKTDYHYRQQHEQFRQQQLAEKERIERERNAKDNAPPAPGSSKPQEESKERTIPRIKTEPVTPPKRPVLTEKGQERGKSDRPPSAEKLKRKQLDFNNKSGSENLAAAEGSERPPQEDVSRSKAFIHQQHQEEMRQYLLYQQKVQEQQRKFEEEQRRKLEASSPNPESVGSQKEKENRTDRDESRERPRSGAPSPSVQHNPPKNRSPCPPIDDKKHRGSPSTSSPPPMSKDHKGIMSSSSSRKVMDYPSYLQHTPYGPVPMHQTPYGAIPIDPNHPAYQHHVNPLVYQAYLGHGHPGHYPGSVVSPMWKSGDEKGPDYEHGRPTSPHQASSSGGPSPSEPPPKALDLLQQHASRYYSSHKHDRARSPADKSRPSSPQRRSASPRKSPETSSSSSRERSDATPMVQHHMHTHQHTHVGMGYPAVLPPYDPFVLASQQAAAAAAAGVTPYPVRRDGMPP